MPLWAAPAWRPGEKYGITPYGTETMHVLRAEKGYIIVGQETDGTVTPVDLGMGWIVGKKKPTSSASARSPAPTSVRSGRKQLVGPPDRRPQRAPAARARSSWRIPPTAIPMPMLGHVTSSYMSPNLGRSIALALLADGRGRIGETLYVPLSRAAPSP